MKSPIDALVEYFNGPNVAKNSIYLQMPSRAEDAAQFFEARSSLGIEGYMETDDAARRVREKLGIQKSDKLKIPPMPKELRAKSPRSTGSKSRERW